MVRFKFFSVIALAAFALAFFASTSISRAGPTPSPPIIDQFEYHSRIQVGETCDTQDSADQCAMITSTAFQVVSTISFETTPPGDIRIDFCTEYDDPSTRGLRCRAVIDDEGNLDPPDENIAEPGQVQMSSDSAGSDTAITGPATTCYTWYAHLTQKDKTHTSEIQCRKVAGGGNDLDLGEYTHGVSSK